ncbi:diguanylate cyclase (GGDEF)-like protein [Anaerosolibacter carboniphilus]|uniref:Diguanylate cyclase (GGDEF)-like protein n=1 Tax=Anaerosolibacter carboniphilus TaxID=1417629 RepID=A0A841KUF4_9FIRM|nr:diguanylate cyclase [Anaerosolibacter carboniphilus]MBB6215650.1 diguanylate cyclase (GGDEF)-like protein [Anaerosolibacter carboniphilus]
MELINGRYKILNHIDKDAYSDSYVALDLYNENHKVVIKLFSPEFSKSNLIQHYIDEFIVFTSFSHDHILQNKSFDIVQSIDNRPARISQFFYTREYIRHAPIRYTELSQKECLDVFMKICSAIHYLHFRGVYYKFLNFDNIMIYREEKQVRVKIKDLAFLKQIEFEKGKIAEDHQQFIAPEIQLGFESDARGDIYSLGIVLFYIYYGVSFKNNEFKVQFEQSKNNRNEAIDSIIKRMVTHDMDERIKSIGQLIRDVKGTLKEQGYTFQMKEEYERLNFNTKLVNRENEMKVILKALEDLKAKRETKVLLIKGEAGIGKSRLIKESLYRFRMSSVLSFFASYDEPSMIQYRSIKEILKQVLKNADYDLIKKYGSELVKLLPSLGNTWEIKPSPVLSEEKEHLRLHDRILHFLCDCLAQQPAVFIIENIHYADKSTLEFIRFLLKSGSNLPALLILTYRANGHKEILQYLNEAYKQNNIQQIQMSKFNLEETAALIQNVLGMPWKPLKLATRIIKLTDGNPRYIEEIIKNLYIEGTLAINEDSKWMIKGDGIGIDNVQLPANIDEALNNQIRSLDRSSLALLKVVSIFNTPVSLDVIGNMCDFDMDDLENMLYHLGKMKILDEKLEDWGYSYDYDNRRLKHNIYQKMDCEEKQLLHQKAAMTLEIAYINEGRENKDELVYQLTKCGSFHKAIDYCLESAGKMFSLNLYMQSLEFIEKVMELFTRCKEDARKIEALLMMGEIYFNIGETDQSLACNKEAIRIAEDFDLKAKMIDGKNRLSNIYLIKKNFSTAKEIISETLSLAGRIDYEEGYLEAGYLLSQLYIEREDISSTEEVVNEFLKKSMSYGNQRYIGLFLNQKGRVFSYLGQYDDAMLTFIKSIEYLEGSKHFTDTIKPINNMGVLLIESVQNTSLARKYYERALKLSERHNLIAGTSTYYLNIGETYLVEDQYQLAIEYFTKAIQIDEMTGERSNISWAYMYLCRIYMNLSEYIKAYNYLQKLEAEIVNDVETSRIASLYHLLKANYYMHVGLADICRECIQHIEHTRISLDITSRFELEGLKIFLHIRNPESATGQEILELVEKYSMYGFRKEKRILLLEAALFFVEHRNLHAAAVLLSYDEPLIQEFDSHVLQYKRAFINTFFMENKTASFEDMLKEISEYSLLEFEWKILRNLGDIYFTNEDYYKAINSYIASLDILRRLTSKVPRDFQLPYINHDRNKRSLKHKIEILKQLIMMDTRMDDKSLTHEDINSINELEDFFDFSHLQSLFHNQKFLTSALKEYANLLPSKINNLRDVISLLSSDHKENVDFILKYCVQVTLATRGFIMLTDELGSITEIIKLHHYQKLPSLEFIIERVNQRQDGILIKRTFGLGQDDEYGYLPDDAKSIICIPIKTRHKEKNTLLQEKRKNWKIAEKEQTRGYLYLDTDKVFNNFDLSAYKTCYSLCSLLYVLLDNYHLKIAASIDRLTNVFIRKYIEKIFNSELIKAEIDNSKFAVIMCDIDRFKLVNDSYGHRKGDEVLHRVAEIIKSNLRESDIVGRYGGEEFIVLLPNTNHEDALAVSEKLRKAVEDAVLLGNEQTVTMSFGVSMYPEHGNTQDELIEKADQALYKAKDAGRNRSVIWNLHIGNDKKRLDKLAGIISGNTTQDHRNVQAIVEIIELLKEKKPMKEKNFEILGRLIEIMEAKQGILLSLDKGQVAETYCRERYKEYWVNDVKINENTIGNVLTKKVGDYFIDWESIHEVDPFTGTPDWQSLIVLPIIYQNEVQGILQLSVPIREKEFDFNNFNFVSSISGVIGAVLHGKNNEAV